MCYPHVIDITQTQLNPLTICCQFTCSGVLSVIGCVTENDNKQ